MNFRWARDVPLRNPSLTIQAGVTAMTLFSARRRAIRANSPVIVSASARPSGGTKAQARINSRTLDGPSLVTTPGAVSPPIECPTSTMSPSPASSISLTTDSTKSAMVRLRRSPCLPRRPGRSTASTVSSGACRRSSSIVSSQELAASPPPCTSTSAGNPIAAPLIAVSAEPHRKARAATARPDVGRSPGRRRP